MGINRLTVEESISTVDQDPPNINGHNSPPGNHSENHQLDGLKPNRRKKIKRISDDVASSSSSIAPNNNNLSSSISRGIRIPSKRGRVNFRRNYSDVDAIAFPLGMSIAAVFSQVLERKDLTSDSTSVDYLSTICASAVRESLTNVFGEKFDAFAVNFEKSFGSTLNTIRLVRNSEIDSARNQAGNSKVSNSHPGNYPAISSIRGECSARRDDITERFTESVNHDVGGSKYSDDNEDVEDRETAQSSGDEVPMEGIVSLQLAHSNSRYLSNHSVLSIIEKSVSEQTRANELKSLEIGLIMKKLQLKETQLALDSDSNFLERCKLSLGISRTSFKVEKFKTQLEETKHGELLKTCADYLVTGLIIMSSCLCCGVYAFSYDNLRQLTKSCYPPEGSKSWWKPMASFNLGWQTLSCQFQVYSRMIFGGLMIGAIAVALIQRSNIASQGMPITFLLLLLGFLCGFVGKVCVDTLGGDGYTWLMFWEVLCMVHFFAIIFNPSLYFILYGSVQVCQVTKYRTLIPFWVRRVLFRLILLLIPVCCGLLPFASVSTWWEDHISNWVTNRWLVTFGEPYDVGSHE